MMEKECRKNVTATVMRVRARISDGVIIMISLLHWCAFCDFILFCLFLLCVEHAFYIVTFCVRAISGSISVWICEWIFAKGSGNGYHLAHTKWFSDGKNGNLFASHRNYFMEENYMHLQRTIHTHTQAHTLPRSHATAQQGFVRPLYFIIRNDS